MFGSRKTVKQETEEQWAQRYIEYGQQHQWATATGRFAKQQDRSCNIEFGIPKHIGVRISPYNLSSLLNISTRRKKCHPSFVVCIFRLSGNPVCDTALAHTNYCRLQQQTSKAYSTSLTSCGSKLCPSDQKLSPQTCDCAYPYEGTLYFRAPSFRELSSINVWHSLEMSLWVKLGLTPGSVSLQNPFFNTDDYLQVYLQLFPSKNKHFNRSEIQMMGFYLSNQTYKPPAGFGPYFFIATPYVFSGNFYNDILDQCSHFKVCKIGVVQLKLWYISEGHGGASIGIGTVVGIATGSTILFIMLIGLLLYAVRQKKRAEKAIGLSRPFGNFSSPSLASFRTSNFLLFGYFQILFMQHLGLQVVKKVEVHHN